MALTVSKFNQFSFFKLPSAWWCGVRLRHIDANKGVTTVRHRWISHPYKEYAKVGLEYFLQHCWEARNQYIRYFSSFLLDEPGEYEYRIAITNLTHFEAVIDFNDFDNQLSRYCTKIGIYPDEQPVPHANKSNYSAANNEEKRLIAFYNRLDVNLYHQWINSSKKSPFFEQF